MIRLFELIAVALLSALMGFAAGQVIAHRTSGKAAPADMKAQPSVIKRIGAPQAAYRI